MSQKTRAVLKLFFETGDKPTQGQFEDLIDSLVNIVDDQWIKISKDFNDFNVAVLSTDIEILSLPAGFELEKHFIRHEIAWSGTGITGVETNLGIIGELDKYMFEPYDIFQAVGDKVFNPISSIVGMEDFNNPTSIRAQIISTGANLDQLLTGTIDYYLWINKLK